MNNTPTATLCVVPGQQNDTFDVRITGIKNPQSIRDLKTQLEAAGYTWRKSERESSETQVCTIGCATGSIIDEADIPLIKRAIEAAGMMVAA